MRQDRLPGGRGELPRKLIITSSQLGADAGITGAIALASREIFSWSGVARLLAEA